VRRGTKLFLLAGCALVLVLEGPRTAAALASGWRGPYAAAEPRTASTPHPLPVPPLALKLARR
jgi:hypothetical protein